MFQNTNKISFEMEKQMRSKSIMCDTAEHPLCKIIDCDCKCHSGKLKRGLCFNNFVNSLAKEIWMTREEIENEDHVTSIVKTAIKRNYPDSISEIASVANACYQSLTDDYYSWGKIQERLD